MTWTAPRTWVTGETVTAALLNTHVRDNLLETSAATVTTAGDLAYADAANSMGSRVGIGSAGGLLVSTGTAPVWRIPASAVRTDSGTSTNSSYETLSTPGGWNFAAEVEVTVTTGTQALVLFGASLGNSSSGSHVVLSYSISGATTTAANDNWSVSYEAANANDNSQFGGFYFPTVTAGSNTFTLEARVSGGTGTINDPRIVVIPL